MKRTFFLWKFLFNFSSSETYFDGEWFHLLKRFKQMLTTIFYLSNFTICKSVSLPFTHSSTYIQIPILYSFFLFCGQSYKASTSVKYYSRVVLTSKLLKFRTLMTSITIVGLYITDLSFFVYSDRRMFLKGGHWPHFFLAAAETNKNFRK